jgi:hypothetical protein
MGARAGPESLADLASVEKETAAGPLKSSAIASAETPDVASEQPPAQVLADEEPKLPLSKARCIALVATVTGASFLNVRDLVQKSSRDRSPMHV